MRIRSRNVYLAIGVTLSLALLTLAVFVNAGILSRGAPADRLGVEGYGVMKVFNPEGVLVGEWRGFNTIASDGLNAVAACAGGTSATPAGYGSCNGLTNGIQVTWVCLTTTCPVNYYLQTSSEVAACEGPRLTCFATSSTSNQGTKGPIATSGPGTQSACDAVTAGDCTGWNSTATFSGIFTSQTCGALCTVYSAGAGGPVFSSGLMTNAVAFFDTLGTSQNIAGGDTLVVTIAFVVS